MSRFIYIADSKDYKRRTPCIGNQNAHSYRSRITGKTTKDMAEQNSNCWIRIQNTGILAVLLKKTSEDLIQGTQNQPISSRRNKLSNWPTRASLGHGDEAENGMVWPIDHVKRKQGEVKTRWLDNILRLTGKSAKAIHKASYERTRWR